jgi:hypothetical protein
MQWFLLLNAKPELQWQILNKIICQKFLGVLFCKKYVNIVNGASAVLF